MIIRNKENILFSAIELDFNSLLYFFENKLTIIKF